MPFSPSDISGLKIWLKADAGAGSSDGDPVGTWTDQSGTSHDFTQATSGKKPLYKVSIRNGLPVVRFDGSDDEMSGGDLTGVFTSAGSMFMAVNGTGVNNKFMAYQTKANDPHWAYSSGEGYWGFFRSSRLPNTPGGGLPRTAWHVWSMTGNGSAYKMWLDSIIKINDGAFTFDGGNAHLIGHQTNDGYYQAMDLGEVIVYDSVLSDGDRVLVQNYLLERWGFQVSGFVLTVVPSLPTGSINVLQTVTGVALTTVPSLPTGSLNVAGVLFGNPLTATPSLPAGSLRRSLFGVSLSATPTFPVAVLRHRITGVALTTTPTMPAGAIPNDLTVNGVALVTVPSLPAGALHYGGSPGAATDFWVLYLGPSDG